MIKLADLQRLLILAQGTKYVFRVKFLIARAEENDGTLPSGLAMDYRSLVAALGGTGGGASSSGVQTGVKPTVSDTPPTPDPSTVNAMSLLRKALSLGSRDPVPTPMPTTVASTSSDASVLTMTSPNISPTPVLSPVITSSSHTTPVNTPPPVTTNAVPLPLVTCLLCSDEVPANQISPTLCCGKTICATCFAEGEFIMLDDAECMMCHGELTPHLYSAILDDAQMLRIRKALARKHEGGWCNCSVQGCKGGAGQSSAHEGHAKCETCRTVFCVHCAEEGVPGYGHSHLGKTCEAYRESLKPASSSSTSGKASVSDDAISEEETWGWMGIVQCPYCGQGVMRDQGCDVLTCACKKQFAADGGKSDGHSFAATGFEKALLRLDGRSSRRQLEDLLKEHAKMAGIFRLPQLLARLERAHREGDADRVIDLCGKLGFSSNLRDCLMAVFMPTSDIEAEFNDAIAGATTLQAVHDILTDPRFAGVYANQAGDAAIVLDILANRSLVAFALVSKCNKLSDARCKKKVTELVNKGKF